MNERGSGLVACAMTLLHYLPSLAQYWDDAYSEHAVHGTKKRLAEQFGLIGVVPRGLEGGTIFKCASWRLFPGIHRPEPFQLDAFDSVFSAVMCNDMPYDGDTEHHQARIVVLSNAFPAASGAGMQFHCAYREGAQAVRPPLSRLAAAGDILLVHAFLDPVTPLQSARTVFEHTSMTHVLIADGIERHGVFGFTDSACVEDTIGRYLLTGILPAGREYRCAAEPAAHGGPRNGFAHPLRAASLRSELSPTQTFFRRPLEERP